MAYFFRRQINSFIQLTQIILQCDSATTAVYEMFPYGKGEREMGRIAKKEN